ncbi:MAG TPA: hypothetical protein PKA98_13395 [Acidimicrobiales bacterium]|nr:hypothetical protein [Acidimicrobiales bacterium]
MSPGSKQRRKRSGGAAPKADPRNGGKVRSSRVGGISDDEWSAYLRQHFQRRRRQNVVAAVLAVVGVLVIVTHFLEHMDSLDLLGSFLSSSVQDLVAGFPAGAVPLLIALILWGQRDNPPTRAEVAKQLGR